jgi:hypothetical protein
VDWSEEIGSKVGFDAATLDVHWADREPAKQSVADILDTLDMD